MKDELLIIVPTRGRPENAAAVIEAWEKTRAFEDGARLLFAVDMDDPEVYGYREIEQSCAWSQVGFMWHPRWMPMVEKLNVTAMSRASSYAMLGFAGDDHLPRTEGWVRSYRGALRTLRTGIVYGDDGFQGKNLPTQWAMTSDIVTALGAMVPGGVQHLYCDNIIRDLGQYAGCLYFDSNVMIEHMHPLAGKANLDAGYRSVNARGQYDHDREKYLEWRSGQARADVAKIRKLREG